MNSYFISYISKDETRSEIEMHINFFLKKINEPMITEIGILIKNYESVEKIALFIPYVNIEDRKHDIYEKIKNQDILRQIFNGDVGVNNYSNFSVMNLNHEKVIIIDSSRYIEECNHNESRLSGHVKIEHASKQISAMNLCYNVDKMKSEIKKEVSDFDGIYFRLRFKADLYNSIVTAISDNKINSIFYSGSYAVRHIFDIRVNDIRNLPYNYSQMFLDKYGYKIANITKILLYFMDTTNSSIENFTSDTFEARILEENLWDKYIETEYIERKVAYKWERNKSENNVFLFRRIVNRLSKATFIISILASLIIGVLASLIATYIMK